MVRIVGTPTSTTEPHAWHSPHRPTHFTVVHPHSAQRYPLARADALDVMSRTLGEAADRLPATRPRQSVGGTNGQPGRLGAPRPGAR